MTARLRLPAACLVLILAAARPGSLPGQSKDARREAAVSSLTLFAGTAEGLWRTTNWGYDWTRIKHRGLEGLGAARFVFPMGGTRVYAGGDGGLYVSEDFGETWSRLYSDGPALCVRPSRFLVGDPTVFLGTPSGLLKSEDGGLKFRETLIRGTAVPRIEWPGPALVVATGQGVRVSEDAAEHFQPEGRGLPAGETRALAVSSYFVVDPVLFAGVGSAGVFRSRDGARTWEAAGLAGHIVNDLAWLGPILYAATDAGLYRSDDVAQTWTPLGQGLADKATRYLLFPLMPATGAEAFLGTARGVFWTGDGGLQWRASGLAGQTVLCLATFPPPEPPSGKKKRR